MIRKLVLAAAIVVGATQVASAQGQNGLIVQLAPGVSPYVIASKYRIRVRDFTPGAPFVYFVGRYRFEIDRVQARMATDPQIVWAEDDGYVPCPETQRVRQVFQKGSTLPSVGDRTALYQENTAVLQQINWSQQLASTPGRQVRIAILDTGLSPQQQYLWDKVDVSANFVEPSMPAYDTPLFQDSNRNLEVDEMTGHGTMVAGIIDQISPQSRFVIARIADSDGTASAWTLIKGLAFAAVNDAEVANISLGTLSQIPALTDVMDWVEQQGMVVVAAIGNNNLRAACYPGRVSKVVCVTGLKEDLRKAPFSNWDGKADAAAPATGIKSQNWDGTIGLWSGTSFATPFVSGALIDAVRLRPTRANPDTLHDAVEESGKNINSLNSQYQDRLGTLLDFVKLHQFVNGGG